MGTVVMHGTAPAQVYSSNPGAERSTDAALTFMIRAW